MKIINRIKLAVAVAAVSIAATCAQAQTPITIVPSPFGGNDNGSFQSFGATNTLVAGANLTILNGSNTNGAAGLGGFVDVSAFRECTLVLTATNAYANPVTNVFQISKGYGAGPVLSFETSPTLKFTVVVPGQSYVMWTTNLLYTDLSGVGFLELYSLTNSAPTSTNGFWAYGTTNFPATGFTNNVGIGLNIGVATKVLHSLR